MAKRDAKHREAEQPESTSASDTTKRPGPEQTFQSGNVRATVWHNESDKGQWYSASITKTVRTKDNQYKDVNSFGKSDLEHVSKVAGQANEYIQQQEKQVDAPTAGPSAPDAAQQYGNTNAGKEQQQEVREMEQ